MGRNEQKRQKQLARKKKKRNTKKSQTSTNGVLSQANSARQMASASTAPIHECLVSDSLFEQGIGHVIFSRKMLDGRIALGSFMLDVHCLGVKDAIYNTATIDKYQGMLQLLASSRQNFTTIHPSCTRKLIEECALYAKNIGFNPHPDYKIAKQIFGDIDATTCPEKYEFGKNGKPFYFVGPHDTPSRQKTIMKTLERTCGRGNFDYVINISEDM